MMSIGVGIIGWGAIAENLHGPCLAGMEECDLIAVCDEREERLGHANETYGCKGYGDIDAFLADPDIQLVTVALPNFLHGPISLRVLQAGKNVISEKPMSFSLSETDEMIKAAREKGLVVTTHQNRRWDPDFMAIRELREGGQLGKLHMIQSRHLGGPWKKTWAGSSKFTGKAPFMSMGPHLLDQILTLSPEGPVRVSGVVKSILNEDDYVNCFLTFSDDSTARVEMSKATRLRSFPRFHASFEKGDVMTTTGEDGSWLHTRLDGEKEKREQIPDPPDFPVQSQPFYRNVRAVIRGEEALIVKSEQSRRYVAVGEAIVRSSEEGVTVMVE